VLVYASIKWILTARNADGCVAVVFGELLEVVSLDRKSVDLVLGLGERNTPRSFATDDCEHDADYYVLIDAVLSEYVCEQHLEQIVERAQA
jgi:hypothetical protein